MSSMLHARAWRLLEHRELLRRERRAAQALCERLDAARRFAPPHEMECLNQVIRQAEQLERYFREMDDLTDRMYTDFGMISRRTGEMLEENTHWYDRFAR